MITLTWMIVFIGISFGLGALTVYVVTTWWNSPKRLEFPPKKLTKTEKFLMELYNQQKEQK